MVRKIQPGGRLCHLRRWHDALLQVQVQLVGSLDVCECRLHKPLLSLQARPVKGRWRLPLLLLHGASTPEARPYPLPIAVQLRLSH